LNAANEIAVSAFLRKQIAFVEIATVIEQVLEEVATESADSYEVILAADLKAREIAEKVISNKILA
jgi:1-deoxy-D-xylulose-5-phosphate reductoisomerase